jgi:glutamate synthase domain-containing protein 1
MCGIVGLFAKSPAVEERLGEHLAGMLEQMSDRGPDSAGVAVYRDPVPFGASKLTLCSADPEEDWDALAASLRQEFGGSDAGVRGSHAVVVVDAEARAAEDWVQRNRPDIRVMSAGQVIEIYKETGSPVEFLRTRPSTSCMLRQSPAGRPPAGRRSSRSSSRRSLARPTG